MHLIPLPWYAKELKDEQKYPKDTKYTFDFIGSRDALKTISVSSQHTANDVLYLLSMESNLKLKDKRIYLSLFSEGEKIPILDLDNNKTLATQGVQAGAMLLVCSDILTPK